MLPIHKSKLSVFNYDEIPAGYYYQAMLKGSAVQRFWHRKKFEEVAKRIQDGERVLDFGCGPGSFVSILGELRPKAEVIGVDVGSSQIRFAMEEIAPRFGGRVSFQALGTDEKKLPFEDASFDVVTGIEVIEHIHPYVAMNFLREAVRVLKPNGRLILTTPNYRSFWPLVEWVLEKLSTVKYHDQHISKFTPNSLVKFVESAGLDVIQVKTLFMLAPFLAGVSNPLAQTVLHLERQSGLRLGNLLIVEAKNRKWD